MADTKITALTALTAADPSTDVLPIVDTSDTTMAASGTTKKISINNILGASGTATLASATISGAATVGTTLGVTGVSTFAAGTALLPALTTTGDTNTGIYYPAADTFAVTTGGTERYRVDSSGNVGIGVTPSAWRSAAKALQVGGVGCFWSSASTAGSVALGRNVYENSAGDFAYIVNDEAAFYEQTATGVHAWYSAAAGTGTISFGAAKMTLDASGNLGIGVTPSAWRNTQRALQIGAVGGLFSSAASTGSTCVGRNVYESASGSFTYIVNDEATFYEQTATGTHAWYTAAAGTGTISFGDAKMTLDASGNLILLSSNTPATLTTNGQLTVNATSNTNLRFSYRGSDGVTRVANITLA